MKKFKRVECPDCLGWGTYDANDPLKAGRVCDRCEGTGRIIVPEDSNILNWNIGGSQDISYGT